MDLCHLPGARRTAFQVLLPLLKKASQESPHKGMSCSKAVIVNMCSINGSITRVTIPKALSYHCKKKKEKEKEKKTEIHCKNDSVNEKKLPPQKCSLDTSDPSSIKNAAARVSERLKGAGLNLLVNNAAIVKPSTLDSDTAEGMAEVYNTNVIGPFLASQAFLPLLKKAAQDNPQKGMSCSKAAIVNLSSEGGSITNIFMWHLGHVLSYRCSKAALNMLTKCQSLGYAADEILCIALHPGWVQTDMGNSGTTQTPLALDVSVREILKTLAHLSEKDNGTFVNWEGKAIPW